MVLHQQNDDWLEGNAVGAALAGLTSFTVSCWVRPSSTGTATLPVALTFANFAAAPLEWLALFATAGVWAWLYDDGVGAEIDAIAPFDLDTWRFIAVVFSPGTTPGTWKITTYSRKPDGSAVWDFQFTYDNRRRASNTLWAEATTSTPLAAATFGYYGHVQHLKVWGAALTGDQLWRESQLALPMVTDQLVTWNPLAIEWDGQQYRQQQGSAGGGYAVALTSPSDDLVHAPITTRPQPTVLVLGAPNSNPTLATGALQLAAENLQTRTGLAARLCSGALGFVGGCLAVAGVGAPALAPGSMQFVGSPLTAAVAIAAPLAPGSFVLAGAPPAAALGAGAPIDGGALSWQGLALAPVLGLSAPLPAGELLLLAEGLQAVAGAPPTVVEGFEATVVADAPTATVAAADVVAAVAVDVPVTVAAADVAAVVAPETIAAETDDPPSATVT